jgi:hypothetical protein
VQRGFHVLLYTITVPVHFGERKLRLRITVLCRKPVTLRRGDKFPRQTTTKVIPVRQLQLCRYIPRLCGTHDFHDSSVGRSIVPSQCKAWQADAAEHSKSDKRSRSQVGSRMPGTKKGPALLAPGFFPNSVIRWICCWSVPSQVS